MLIELTIEVELYRGMGPSDGCTCTFKTGYFGDKTPKSRQTFEKIII